MCSEPTPFPELNDVLAELVLKARATLGADFIGANLQGSFALGEGDECSDVDFVIVTRSDLTATDVSALNAMHGALYELPSVWAQHLEGSYMPTACLRGVAEGPRDAPGERRSAEWRDPQTGAPPTRYPFWYLNNGDHSLVRSQHDNTLVVRRVLREHGIALFGPDIRELIDPVDPGALRGEVRDVMHSFGADLVDGVRTLDALWLQGFTVLFFCRTLHALATGTIASKREAADWAKGRVDERWWPLIDGAWEQRARYPRGKGAPAAHAALRPAPDDVRDTLAFVRYALAFAARYEAGAGAGRGK